MATPNSSIGAVGVQNQSSPKNPQNHGSQKPRASTAGKVQYSHIKNRIEQGRREHEDNVPVTAGRPNDPKVVVVPGPTDDTGPLSSSSAPLAGDPPLQSPAALTSVLAGVRVPELCAEMAAASASEPSKQSSPLESKRASVAAGSVPSTCAPASSAVASPLSSTSSAPPCPPHAGPPGVGPAAPNVSVTQMIAGVAHQIDLMSAFVQHMGRLQTAVAALNPSGSAMAPAAPSPTDPPDKSAASSSSATTSATATSRGDPISVNTDMKKEEIANDRAIAHAVTIRKHLLRFTTRSPCMQLLWGMFLLYLPYFFITTLVTVLAHMFLLPSPVPRNAFTRSVWFVYHLYRENQWSLMERVDCLFFSDRCFYAPYYALAIKYFVAFLIICLFGLLCKFGYGFSYGQRVRQSVYRGVGVQIVEMDDKFGGPTLYVADSGDARSVNTTIEIQTGYFFLGSPFLFLPGISQSQIFEVNLTVLDKMLRIPSTDPSSMDALSRAVRVSQRLREGTTEAGTPGLSTHSVDAVVGTAVVSALVRSTNLRKALSVFPTGVGRL